MYDSLTASVLWYLSWPLMILLSYQCIRIALRIHDKKNPKQAT